MHYEEMDLFLTSTTKHSLFINLELSYIRGVHWVAIPHYYIYVICRLGGPYGEKL